MPTHARSSRAAALVLLGFLLGWLAVPLAALGQGQFYPVHATVHLLPPLGPYLSDLSAPGRDRVAITLLNRDLQQPLLQARLQVRLRAPGLEATTRPEAPRPPLELPAGVPLRLAGAELAAYLAPGALAATGYLPNGRLPAGPLEVAARALAPGTGRALSGWAVARVYLPALDPPMLLAPAAGARIPARTPQHILFRWAPRGPAVGAAYAFELRELPVGDAPPAAAFDYGLEVHRATTRAAQLSYGPLEPPLQPGRRYAWRVRLLPAEGAAGAPAHGGLSAVGWFELGGGCDAPAGLRARPGPGRAELSWAPVAGAARYTVACRPRTALNRYAWAETTAEVPRLTLGRLAPGATYEWRVGASAPGDARPAFSGVATFTVPPAGAAAAPSPECGRPAPPRPPRSRAPKLDLRAGDTVIAGGDFRVRVTALRPLGDGWYAGRGTVRLRAIVDAPIAVRFDRLRVNADGYQIGGLVEAVRDGDGGVADLDRLDDGGGAPRPGAPRLREVALGFTLPPAPSLRLDTAARALRVVDAAGQPHTLRLDAPANADYRSLFPLRVTDAAGRAYRVDLPGEGDTGDGADAGGPAGGRGVRLSVVALGRVAPFDTAAAAPGPRVRFGPHPAARFALDPGDTPWYRGAVKLDAFYRPDAAGRIAPWKLVPVGESDPVLARVEGDPLDTAGVRFARADGEAVPAAWSPRDSGWSLTLDAPGPGEAYDLFAARGGCAAGRLRVVAYPRQRHAVTLAPVGDAALDTAALSRALGAIYGPAGVELALRVDGRLRGARGWDLDGDGRLRLPGGGLPALLGGAESEEMRALQRAYRAAGGAAEGPVLFVLGGAAGPGGEAAALAGEMPRGQRFGYLFGGGGPGLARAIAHELGHGLFTLQHTFDPEYGGAASRGQTDNLMDYGSGAALAAFQWAIMARPAALTGWDRAEAGQIVREEVLVDAANAGLAPDGRVIYAARATAPGTGVAYGTAEGKPHVLGFTLYQGHTRIKRYGWHAAQGTYVDGQGGAVEDAGDIDLVYNVADTPVVVRQYYYAGDRCTYQYQDARYSRASGFGPPLGARRAGYLWDADSACRAANAAAILQQDRNGCDEGWIQDDLRRLAALPDAPGAGEATTAVNSACLGALRALPYPRLISILRAIAGGPLREAGELAALRVMRAIDTADYAQLFNDLETDRGALLTQLLQGMDDHSLYFWDGRNYTALMGALATMYRETPGAWMPRLGEAGPVRLLNLSPPAGSPAARELAARHPGRDATTGEHRYAGRYDAAAGRVDILRQVRHVAGSGRPGPTPPADYWVADSTIARGILPMAPILVAVGGGPTLGDLAAGAGGGARRATVVPAIFLAYYTQKSDGEDLARGIQSVLDATALLGAAPSALATEISAARRAWAVAELVGAAGNMAANARAIDDPDARRALDLFNGALALVGIQHAGRGAYRAVAGFSPTPSARDGLARMRAGFSEALTSLRQRPGAWGAVPEETRAALARGEAVLEDLAPGAAHTATTVRFKQGKSAKKILDFPKGERPAPETYLEPDYIQEHLDKFKREGVATRFISKSDYETFGIGKPDQFKTEFVGLKSEMDKLLSLPASERAKKLGIPESQLGKKSILRIDFKITEQHPVFMPSGNEFGANAQWIPGGILPDGELEAVIRTEGMVEGFDYTITEIDL